MWSFFIAYLALGAAISLAHPWIRGRLAKFFQSGRTGGEAILSPVLGCLAFVISCIVWPIALRSAGRARRKKANDFDRLLNDPCVRKANPLFYGMVQLSAGGTDADEIPGGIGGFGLVATNPVPTFNIFGSKYYLDRLWTDDGQKVRYERRGSIVPAGGTMPVDIYDLTNPKGEPLGAVFISPYHRKNSEKAPKGFVIGPPSKPTLPTVEDKSNESKRS
jgi:hypothetical protein